MQTNYGVTQFVLKSGQFLSAPPYLNHFTAQSPEVVLEKKKKEKRKALKLPLEKLKCNLTVWIYLIDNNTFEVALITGGGLLGRNETQRNQGLWDSLNWTWWRSRVHCAPSPTATLKSASLIDSLFTQIKIHPVFFGNDNHLTNQCLNKITHKEYRVNCGQKRETDRDTSLQTPKFSPRNWNPSFLGENFPSW